MNCIVVLCINHVGLGGADTTLSWFVEPRLRQRLGIGKKLGSRIVLDDELLFTCHTYLLHVVFFSTVWFVLYVATSKLKNTSTSYYSNFTYDTISYIRTTRN